MIICRTVQEVRHAVQVKKSEGNKIGFVPTMGALHQGHMSLIRQARHQTDTVVVSIFVNPTQFGPNEDFDSYPRELQNDLDKCEQEKVDIVFAPEQSEMYDGQTFLTINIESLNKYMCGASRPGFFEGVLLIVNKLFNTIMPDVAYFGQKDIQQFQIISHMVREFNQGTELVMSDIIRADDGLALSSRNAYLSDEERKTAPGLYRALSYIEKQVLAGVDTPSLLISHQRSELEAKGFKIDYLNVYSLETLQPVYTLKKNVTYIIAGAVYLGETRLIDNLLIEMK